MPSWFGIRARSPEIWQGAGIGSDRVPQQRAGREGREVRRAWRPGYSPGPLQLLEGAGADPLARLLQGTVVLRGLPGEGDRQDSLSERVEAATTTAPTPGGPGAQEGGRRHVHAGKGIVFLQLLLPGAPGPVGQLRLNAGGERRGPGRLQLLPRCPARAQGAREPSGRPRAEHGRVAAGDQGRQRRGRRMAGARSSCQRRRRARRGERAATSPLGGGEQAEPRPRAAGAACARLGRATLLAAGPLLVLQRRPSVQRDVGEEGEGSLAAPRVHARLPGGLGRRQRRLRWRRLGRRGGRGLRLLLWRLLQSSGARGDGAGAAAAAADGLAGGGGRGGGSRRHCVRLRRYFRDAPRSERRPSAKRRARAPVTRAGQGAGRGRRARRPGPPAGGPCLPLGARAGGAAAPAHARG